MNIDRRALVWLAPLFSALFACGASATVPAGEDAATPGVNDAGSTADTSVEPSDAATPTPESGAATECSAKPLPTSCEASATTMPAAGDFGSVGTYAVTVETFESPHPTAPSKPISIYLPTGKKNNPVLFFSHAFGATDVMVYDALFRRLVSHGIAIVHVPYAPIPAGDAKNDVRYAQLWQGFAAAAARNPLDFDLAKVGFVGHSFGGGATPEMARRGFVERGWGASGKLMMILAPWYSWGTGYGTLPADVRTVVQVYADDDTNDLAIASNDIWSKIPQVTEKRWQLVRTDRCDCGLLASHTAPMTAAQTAATDGQRDNGLDVWTVARRLEALAAYTFDGNAAAKAIAFGDDGNQGRWVGCGGRAVRLLEASTTPLLAACGAPYQYPAADRCKSADPGVVCP